jgi:hypothetical protein
VHDALPGLAHQRDRRGLIPAKKPGHAAEGSIPTKRLRPSKIKNRAESDGVL